MFKDQASHLTSIYLGASTAAAEFWLAEQSRARPASSAKCFYLQCKLITPPNQPFHSNAARHCNAVPWMWKEIIWVKCPNVESWGAWLNQPNKSMNSGPPKMQIHVIFAKQWFLLPNRWDTSYFRCSNTLYPISLSL